MGKFVKTVLAASVLAATSQVALAEVSANVGVTSNYMWRGVTQNNDSGAVQGGIDYSHESGFYAGTWVSEEGWTSSTGNGTGYEQDLYLGFSGSAGSLGYDVGYIDYTYPGTKPSADFKEVYLKGSFDKYSAKVSYDSENKNMYIEAAADFPLPQGYGLGVHVGSYNFDVGTDYTDYSLTVSKDDFSMAFSDTSDNVKLGQTDNMRVAVSYTKSF